MIRRTPRSTRTDTLFPSPALSQSPVRFRRRARDRGRRPRGRAGLLRPVPAPGLARGVRRAGRRLALPAPRRPDPGRVHRRLRPARPPDAAGGRAMSASRTSDLWWKNGIIYCLDVETFLDTDGDGKGDLAGLTRSEEHTS